MSPRIAKPKREPAGFALARELLGLKRAITVFHDQLDELLRWTRRLETESAAKSRHPITVLMLGQQLLRGERRDFGRDFEQDFRNPPTIVPCYASKTIWLAAGDSGEARFTFVNPIAAGAWVIALGGGHIVKLQIGDMLQQCSYPGSTGSLALTSDSINVGMDMICVVHCGEQRP